MKYVAALLSMLIGIFMLVVLFWGHIDISFVTIIVLYFFGFTFALYGMRQAKLFAILGLVLNAAGVLYIMILIIGLG